MLVRVVSESVVLIILWFAVYQISDYIFNLRNAGVTGYSEIPKSSVIALVVALILFILGIKYGMRDNRFCNILNILEMVGFAIFITMKKWSSKRIGESVLKTGIPSAVVCLLVSFYFLVG